MRLLHAYSGNLFGGIETILITLARSRSFCPEMTQEYALAFDGRLSAELREAGVRVHQLGGVRVRQPQTVFAARREFRRLLASGDFDCVVCHAPWTQGIFGGVARRARLPLVFWAHDAMGGCHWTERLARRSPPDLVMCNSQFTAGTVARVYSNVPREVIYAPVQPPPAVARDEIRAIRRSLDTPDAAVVVVQASRAEAWKGHALLLDALRRLRDLPGWILWQVGGAQRPQEAAFLTSLREAAARYEIADRVRWVGERTDVGAVLSAADIYCQANLAPEPFGVVFVEALFAGIPVVTADLGGAREIVDGTCGALVEPGNAEAFAAVLSRLIVDPSSRETLARGCVSRAASLCDPAAQVRRLASVLESSVCGRLHA